MFTRLAGAALRGILVALLVATPSLLLPAYTAGSTEMVALLAILAGVLTFAEYNTEFPSILEFRDAPPLNRQRFFCLFAIIFLLTIVAKNHYEPSSLTMLVAGFGGLIGHIVDFPYSPVRLVLLMLPDETLIRTKDFIRLAAGVSYVVALITVLSFVISVRILGWPTSRGAFNVWVNLPLFDPTTGGDVVRRLRRDGNINIVAGVLLPFVIPAAIKLASDWIDPAMYRDPQTVIWVVSAWAFLPASMIMRGVAMTRIAQLIEEKRRRVYANAASMQTA